MDVQLQVASDLTKFVEDLRATRAELTGLKQSASESFVAAANSTESAEKELAQYVTTIKAQKEALDEMTRKLKELEKANKTAFQSDESAKYIADIKKLKDEITKLKEEAGKFGKETETSNKKASASVQVLLGVIDAAKEKLATLKQGSGAFEQLSGEIKASEIAMASFGNETEETGNNLDTAKKKLKDFQTALQNLKLAGLDQTQVYKDLKKEAGNLKDTITDVADEVKLAGSDTRGFDRLISTASTLTAGFGLVEGAAALFGSENEELQKSLLKVNAAMTILTSLQQIQNELSRKDSILTAVITKGKAAYAAATSLASSALGKFKLALAATGIGALVVALGAIVTYWDDIMGAIDGVDSAQKDLNETTAKQLDIEQKKLEGINDQENVLKLQGKSEKEILDLKIKQIDAVIEATAAQIKQAEITQQLQTKAAERNRDLLASALKFVNLPLRFMLDTASAAINGLVALINKIPGVDIGKGVDLNLFAKLDTKVAELIFDPAETAKKGQEERDALQKQYDNLINQRAGFQLQLKKTDGKAGKDGAKEQQERLKQITELEKQLQEAQIAAMKDGRQKQIAEENQTYNERISALKERLGTAQGRELELIQQNIEQESSNHKARSLAIDIDYYAKATEAFTAADTATKEIFTQGQAQEEEAVKKRFAGVLAAIENAQKQLGESVQSGLGDPFGDTEKLAQLNVAQRDVLAKQQQELNAIDLKFKLERLAKQEELALAENDVIEVSGANQAELEEVKEQNKLRILIDYSKSRIDLLKTLGTEESEPQILQLQKVIQDLEKALSSKPAGKKDLSETLGLKLSDQEKDDLVSGAKELFSTITDLYQQSITNRIDESQRLIDALEEQIDAQEEVVEREKELMDKGYANNLELEQRKLDDLKTQKAQEAEELKKAQEAQAKFAKAQVLINGVIAASNLAVSAATYFKEGSKLGPVVGTVLALAAIATMLSTFVAVKKKSESAAKFRHGGELDLTGQSTRHESGGIGLYDGKTGQKIAEAEGGEYAYFFRNGKHAKQFEPLFELINKGLVPKMPTMEPINLPDMGSVVARVVGLNNQQNGNSYDPAVVGELRNQSATLKKIADGEKTTYENGYRVERRPNHTRRVKIA